MKVYFCGSIRGGRDDVEIYLRIVTKLQSYATVLTEHVSKRELGDTGQKSVHGPNLRPVLDRRHRTLHTLLRVFPPELIHVFTHT